MPIRMSKYDRDNNSLAFGVTFKRLFHLDIVTVVGSKKIGTNQQQDYVIVVDAVVYRIIYLFSGTDLPVVPSLNNPLSL